MYHGNGVGYGYCVGECGGIGCYSDSVHHIGGGGDGVLVVVRVVMSMMMRGMLRCVN